MKKKIKAAILLVISIVFYILTCVTLCITNRPGEIEVENLVFEKTVDEAEEISKAEETIASIVCEDSPMPEPSPNNGEKGETAPVVEFVGGSEVLARITIQTERRTETYEVTEGVSEDILGQSIGHLPSSILPGQEGFCVLMGHRDTEFKILQNLEIGDTLLLNYTHEVYNYVVTKFKILGVDDELRFESLAGENLVLVTCYPFRYTGHAPQKFLVYAKRIN